MTTAIQPSGKQGALLVAGILMIATTLRVTFTGVDPLLDTILDRLIVTPHCAWLGSSALAALSEQLIGNIELFLQGTPRNRVA